MKLLITGSNGFIAKNLLAELTNSKYSDIHDIYKFDIDTDVKFLDTYTKSCDFVIHLAGVNRPEKEEDFMKGNFGFLSLLLKKLIENNNKAPILITSSIQATLNNPYGISKKAGEDLIFNYGIENNVKVLVYRLPNVFGKWCRPNYNSAVATFCHNIANSMPIRVDNIDTKMNLVYIDDLVNEITKAIQGKENRKDEFCYIEPIQEVTLGEIVNLLYAFKNTRKNLTIPNMNNKFERDLYATYLSYLPKEEFSYKLPSHYDNRGSFTEMIRTSGQGQIAVNISKAGITKGNHWHHTKNEKFLVVSGHCLIKLRKIDEEEIIIYDVCGEKLEIVDIPCGYTHSITNIGMHDSVTIMWASECFDPENQDTNYLEVEKHE